METAVRIDHEAERARMARGNYAYGYNRYPRHQLYFYRPGSPPDHQGVVRNDHFKELWACIRKAKNSVSRFNTIGRCYPREDVDNN